MKPTKRSYDIDSCSKPNETMKSPALRKSKYYYINTGSFWHHNICGSTHRWQLRKKTNCLLHFRVLNLINFSMNLSLAARSVLLISKRQYTVCCPVSGRYQYAETLKKNSIFEAHFSVIGKRSISNESWTFQLSNEGFGELKACETVAEDAVLFRSINISWLTLIRCLLRSKISAAQKKVGNMWYFQRNDFIFTVKILKEVRFSESLLILLEIRFVWNNGAQKHSLSIDVRYPVSGQFFLCCTESIQCKELLRKTAETFQFMTKKVL